MTFKDIGLRKELIQAIGELGFETPTPIQAKAIPQLINECTLQHSGHLGRLLDLYYNRTGAKIVGPITDVAPD